MLAFVVRGLRSAVGDLTHYPGLPFLLTVAAAVGVVLVATNLESGWRARLASPIGLAVGSLVFFTITAVGRAEDDVANAEKSRYVHIGLALLLPAVTVAVDALVRRWPALLMPVSALFLIGVPANLSEVHEFNRTLFLGRKREVLVLADSDALDSLPRDTRPFDSGERNISVGWLRDGRASGRIPGAARGFTAVDEADALNLIALSQPVNDANLSCAPAAADPGSCGWRPATRSGSRVCSCSGSVRQAGPPPEPASSRPVGLR